MIVRVKTELYGEDVFIPLDHIDHVVFDKETGKATAVSVEYRGDMRTAHTRIGVEKGQAVRLKMLLDANAFHLDDEVATFPGGA